MTKTVYCIRSNGLLKIGYSAQFEKRLSGLRGASAADVVVVMTLPAARNVEAALHRRLAAHRVRHEWFRDEPEVLSVLTDVKENGESVLAGYLDEERPQLATPQPVRSASDQIHFEHDRISCLQKRVIGLKTADLAVMRAKREALQSVIAAQREALAVAKQIERRARSLRDPDYAGNAARLRAAAEKLEGSIIFHLGEDLVVAAHDDLEAGIKDGRFERERRADSTEFLGF
jgi:hypothetical protein